MKNFNVRIALFSMVFICFLACVEPGYAGPTDPADTQTMELIKKLSQKYPVTATYAIEGSFEAARHVGEDPKEPLAGAKFKLLSAPGMKYRLHAEMEKGSPLGEFDVVSDGKKTWTYLPGGKEYTERPTTPLPDSTRAGELPPDGGRPEPRAFIQEFVLQIAPLLANLPKTADVVFARGQLLTAMSRKDARGYQNLLYLTLDWNTLAISKLALTKAFPVKEDKMLVRCDVSFQKLAATEPVPDAQFTFVPPSDARLVDSLPAFVPVTPPSPAPKNEPAKTPAEVPAKAPVKAP